MWLFASDLPRRLPAQFPVAALVLGDEPLLVEEAAEHLRKLAKDQGFSERTVLEPQQKVDWDELHAQAGSMSLFGDRRLLEVRLPEAKAGTEGGKAITAFVKEAAPDVAMLVIAPTTQAPRETSWMKKLVEAGCGVRCRKLPHDKLPAWLGQRAKSLHLHVEAQALQWLALQVEGNLLAADQELKKLALLGADKTWDLNALQEVVADHARYAGYELPDVLLSGDLAAGMRMVNRLREEGAAPVMLLATLGRDIRSLNQVASAARRSGIDAACDAVGIWRNRKPLFAGALQRLGVAKVRQAHEQVIALDRLAKSAPEPRFWEDLLNLAIHMAGHAAPMSSIARN